MGTRSVIRIEGFKVAKLYKHWSGHPTDMLPWLESFNTDFEKNRPGDPEYKFAQLLRSSVRDTDKFSLDDSLYTGWGVVGYEIDYGVQYEYTLKKDGSVTYREK